MVYNPIITSALDLALLGLLREQPGSGYELRRVFDTPLLRRFSSSPGSIYPALKRLEKNGFVTHEGTPRRGRFAITVKGRKALVGWLTAPVTTEAVEREMDMLLLRFAFMEGVLPLNDRRQFLSALKNAVDGHVASLITARSSMPTHMPLHGRLTLDHQIAMADANKVWVASAAAELGRL